MPDKILFDRRVNSNFLRLTDANLRVSIFILIITSYNFLSMELSAILIITLGLLILATSGVEYRFIKLTWPLFVVLFNGLLGISEHESRHIFRDVAFALLPINLILIGYWVAQPVGIWLKILKSIIVISFFFAIIHLSTFFVNPVLLDSNFLEVRKIAGSTSYLVVLSLVIITFQSKIAIKALFNRVFTFLCVLPVLLASFLLSYSRTAWIVAILLSLSMLGRASGTTKRTFFIAALVFVLVGVLMWGISTGDDDTFQGRILRSLTEISIANYDQAHEINNNWRGYEAYKTLEAYSAGNVINLIFGQGFGALVDIGFYIPLGEADLRYIPITHNGYGYILMKTGALGLFSYVIFYKNIISIALKNYNKKDNEGLIFAKLLMGCILVLFAIMLVVGGMAQAKGAEYVLLLGFFIKKTVATSREQI